MKSYLFTFALGAAVGGAGHWYFTQKEGQAQLAEVRTNAVRIGEMVRNTASEGYEDVKDEIARTGSAVRDKAKSAGATVANAASDLRITTAVKAKLVGESGLSGLSIGVETSGGVVTLTGDVSSLEQVSHAVNAALNVDGVSRVVSRLQVSATKKVP